MELRELYAAIAKLEESLRNEMPIGFVDYRQIKALAATIELQEYLANRIAAEVAAGTLDPDLEG